MNCSVARTLDVVGEWWTMLIIREAFLGVRRFDDIQERLGIARNVLSTRLQALVDRGILERRRYQGRPERFEYRLTEKGLDLYPILVAMMRWGDRWTAGADGPPLTLVHQPCGHETAPTLSCSECGVTLHPRDVRARARDAAAEVAAPGS